MDVLDSSSANKQYTHNIVEKHNSLSLSEPTNTQNDHLITEIESSDGSFATTLRAVYESAERDRFIKRLSERIKGHDREIERMCNFHYQGFIDSIRELLQVSNDANSLKNQIESTNDLLKRSCESLFTKGEQLVKIRMIQKNIATAIESLSLCLPVLEMYGKVKEQMKNKRFYPALKTLEQLEHTYLPRVSAHWFASSMSKTVPVLRNCITEASMSDLKDFLENIRKHSEKIGEVAMMSAAKQNNLDPLLAKRKRVKPRAPPPPNPFTGEIDRDLNPFDEIDVGDDEEMTAQDLVDFSPVYRCFHIYSVMGSREKFEEYYRQQRIKQATLSLQPSQSMHKSLDSYRRFFHDIIGFFVIEDQILHTTSGLVNRSSIDEVWDMAAVKVAFILRSNTALCEDAGLISQIKNLIVLFSLTMKGYGFSVAPLHEVLLDVKDRYNEILVKEWISIFDKIFLDDNYTPITVTDLSHYKDITGQFTFVDEDSGKPFPRMLSFSEFVPKIFVQVKSYINKCLTFSSDLHLSHTEIDDMVRKSTNLLLTQTLSSCLTNLLNRPLQLLQLIQISINMRYLEESCTYLEHFISSITGAEQDGVHVTKLHGTSMFKDAKSLAEEQIYKKLNLKIDEFLTLANYEWQIEEAEESSDFITDLVAFLRSTFMAFTNLPEKVARTACMSACQHIASNLREMLLSNDVRQISTGLLQQFNLDVIQCEDFAKSEPVPGFSDGTLQLAFAELRQLMDLVLNWDWSVYLADFGQTTCKYGRITPGVAINLLEKLNNTEKKKNNLFTSLKKNERDKKKLKETVLRQLRTLQHMDEMYS